MKIRSKLTGETFEVSPHKSRVRRLQKRVKAWADVTKPLIDKVGVDYRLVMITLTYSQVDGWRKNHIREFMLSLRGCLGGSLLSYAWVAELQKRGAVHYHVIVLVKRGTNIPLPDEFWKHGVTRIETARSPFYLLTYTGKEYQKFGKFPKGLRLFAVWIGKDAIHELSRWFFKLSALPAWLMDCLKGSSVIGKPVRRREGGGWCCGDFSYFSPYELVY
jgi:hypothetical protein